MSGERKGSEEWRDVVGYKGKYMVSNHGEILSLNYNNTHNQRKLKLQYNPDGYRIVGLTIGNKTKTKKVHHLVAESFMENRPDGHVLDHIDRDRTNNHVSNLRYVTISENNRNVMPKPNTTSRFKGVSWYGRLNKWRVCVSTAPYKEKYLGVFATEEDAARAYDIEAAKYGHVTNEDLGLFLTENKTEEENKTT